MMLLRRTRFLIFDCRFLNCGSATAFVEKRPTPIEFHKSEIGNQKSSMLFGGCS